MKAKNDCQAAAVTSLSQQLDAAMNVQPERRQQQTSVPLAVILPARFTKSGREATSEYWTDFERDANAAFEWLRQERKAMKDVNKDLYTQFLDIGTRMRLLQWRTKSSSLYLTPTREEGSLVGSLTDQLGLLNTDDITHSPQPDAEISSSEQPLASGYMSLPRKIKLVSRPERRGSNGLNRQISFASIPEER